MIAIFLKHLKLEKMVKILIIETTVTNFNLEGVSFSSAFITYKLQVSASEESPEGKLDNL